MTAALPTPSVLQLLERFGRWSLNRRGHRTRFVATREGRLHVYDARGTGPLPPIVLLHGIGATATAYAPLLARLSRRARRLIALEYPGHGFSDEPRSPLTVDRLFDAAIEALDALVDEPAVLCGNSLGGAVALHYAIARPERVRGLLLLSPAGARMSPEELDELRAMFALRSRRDAQAFLARLYHEVPGFWRVLAHELVDVLGRAVVRDLLESVRDEHAPEPDALRALEMPVTVIWGRSDRVLPASSLAWLRAHLPPHAVIEEPEGVGHSPHLERPQVIAKRIVDFARALPTR